MFHVTPAASRAILACAERSDAAGMALRVAARVDANGQLDFGLGFDDPRDNDQRVLMHGLEVLVGAPSRSLLEGVVLDLDIDAAGLVRFVFVDAESVEPGGCSSKPSTARGGCGSGGCGSCGS